jgi:hypothetical protein
VNVFERMVRDGEVKARVETLIRDAIVGEYGVDAFEDGRVGQTRFAVAVVTLNDAGIPIEDVRAVPWSKVCPGDSIKGPKGWFEVLSVNVSGGIMVEIGIEGRTVIKNMSDPPPLVARGAEGTACDLLDAEAVIGTEEA